MKNWLFRQIPLLIGLGFLCPVPALRAGPVSLEPAEITTLQTLVRQDAEAAKQLAALRKSADAALSDSPDPVARIISEGHLETDPDRIRSWTALRDMDKIACLAWAWAATGETRYADKAREFILAWAKVNQADGNPINETKFEPMIVGYDLLRATFPAEDRSLADRWLRTKATTLRESQRGRRNNWQSHRLKIVGLAGLTLQDPDLWKFAGDGFRAQIADGFSPDGASVDFKERDALHYHLYSVQPLLVLARAGERRGEPLFTYRAPNGASLKAAVDFIVPYAEGKKKHVEFDNSKVKFDRDRAANGEKEYQPHPWDPATAGELFSQAAYFSPDYGKLAARISGKTDQPFFNWQLAANAAMTPHTP